MATISKFEDIIAWQKAQSLTLSDIEAKKLYDLAVEITKMLSVFASKLDKTL